jgi:hypothetical protein
MKKILLAILLLCLSTKPLFAISPSPSASPSGDIDPEMIKENIKKRIEQVVKSQTDSDKKKIAYLGTLSSETTNSFTIETTQGGVKQASTSAYTTFIDVANKNKEVKFEDVSLGDYVAALGFLNEDTEVLDARRILVLRATPDKPAKKSFYGTIEKIDAKKSTITIINAKQNLTKVFSYTSKTDSNSQTESSRKTPIAIKDIPVGTKVIVTFTPKSSNEGEIITTLLVKTPAQTVPSPSPSPSPSPKAKK